MNLSTRFTGALAALSAAVRKRLDGGDDIDWDSLTDPATALGIEEAARTSVRLPFAVETLAERLTAEVGIAPVDVVRGVQGSGTARAWMHAVAIEPDGERYRLRVKRSGEVLPGVRPAALAGYTVLALELATTVHQACEAWARAGAQAQSTPDDGHDGLVQCAVDMHHRLQAFPETGANPPSTLSLALSMEDAWNAQTVQMREALATRPFPHRWDARAPRAHYYATETSYRLHACEIAEVRWLQELGEHAENVAEPEADDGPVEADPVQPPLESIPVSPGIADRPEPLPSLGVTNNLGPDGNSRAGPAIGFALQDDGGALDGAEETPGSPEWPAGLALDDPALDEVLKSELATADPSRGHTGGERPDLEVPPAPPTSIGRPDDAPDTGASLLFGTPVEVRSPQIEIDLLVQTARRVPAAVTRRLADACGDATSALLDRLENPDSVRDLRDTLGTETPGNAVPAWMEELAGRLLLDTGAETRDGLRTGPVRLNLQGEAEGLSVDEVATSAFGIFRAIDVVEQVRLSLSFACDTWSALTLLDDAGKEAQWTLRDAATKEAKLAHAERTRLEATLRIEHELQRILRTKADESPAPPSALEEAALTANALKSLQPSERADAGWPPDAGSPNPRDPRDIARVVAAAEALRRDVRVIANRLIADRATEGRPAREARGG